MIIQFIERIKQLEKEEVSVEYIDSDDYFLPNFALKVQDVSNTLKDKIQNEVLKDTEGRQVAFVYDIALYRDDMEITPQGKMKIRLPLVNGLKNASLLIETEDGQFKTVIPTIENGYYVYESDILGVVSILGDVEDAVEPDPLPDKLPDEQSGGAMKEGPSTSVKGTYTQAGADTGDTTSMTGNLLGAVLSLCFLRLSRGGTYKRWFVGKCKSD